MEIEEQEKGYYYRAIARHFFFRRGAPFLLSPRELEIIARWEAASVPLSIVLEGIDRAVEKVRRKKRPLSFLSLVFCDQEVQKVFKQYQERQVGANQPPLSQDKNEKIREAITDFLNHLPSALTHLRPIFLEALEILKLNDEKKEEKERKLEVLEEAIEEALLKEAGPEDKRDALTWIEREFPESRGSRKDEVFKIALLKLMREKYKVPHLLAFYY
ncbi:MAG: hypothetical protein N3B16_09595 [Candidatus Aminicenantes bacterium]|nr:hypothetical protein [Candidatus Aminicenantes bacterium]